jgi:diguanylate cyclase (GGDEF)-like protein
MLVEHELLRRSNLDPVTEVATQQAFQDSLEREWRRASRDRMPVSIIMIEVDHFRAFNERVGKPQSDAVLKTIADALKQLVHRPGDVLARYGAGKFAVVLGGTAEEGAMTLAERLRTCVETLKIANAASPNEPCLTASLGVASVRPDRDAAWQDIELIAVAERGLATAKESGRNRVVLDQPVKLNQPLKTP